MLAPPGGQVPETEGLATGAPETAPQEAPGGGFGETAAEIGLGIIAGADQAVKEVFETTGLDSVVDWLEEKFPLGEVYIPPPETTAGQVASGLAQVGIALVPAARITRALGAVSSFLRWTVAGALVDFAAFDPDDPAIGELAGMLGELDSPILEEVRSTIQDALSKDEDDTELVKRLKTLGGGVLAGALIDGIQTLYRATRGLNVIPPAVWKTLGISAGVLPFGPSEAEAREIEVEQPPEEKPEGFQLAGFVEKLLKPFVGKAGREALERPPTSFEARQLREAAPPGTAEIESIYTGYKTDAIGIDFNLERIETTDQVKEVIDIVSEAYEKKIAGRTGGVIPHDVTRQVADLIGSEPEDVARIAASLPSDVKDLHVRALVMRDLMVESAEEVDRLAERIATIPSQVTDEERLFFRAAIERHAALQANMKGVQTEIARGLAAFRIPAESGALARAQIVLETLSASGGRSTIDELARAWKNTPIEKRAELAEKTRGSRVGGVIREIWINGLLSSPRTHELNLFGNYFFTAFQVPERAIAGAIGAARRAVGIGADQDRIYMTEAPALLLGWVESVPEAFRLGWHVFKTDTPIDPLTKIESVQHRNIATEKFGLDETSLLGRFVDLVGTGVRLPGRFLMSVDEFNKGMGRRMELRAQAYRLSQQELEQGKTVEEAAETYADVLGGKNQTANLARDEFASTITFTKQLGEAGQAIQQMARRVPGMWLIAPFIRTPTNIIKEFIARTPAAPVLREVRQDLLAGGARRDLALAKISLGTATMAWASHLTAQGIITGGGPSDFRLRKIWLEKFQPYSINLRKMLGEELFNRLGLEREWIPYGRIEPLGLLFGVAADFTDYRKWAPRDLADEAEETLATRAVASTLHKLSEKQFFTGISDFAAAYNDPESKMQRWVSRISGSMMPFSSFTRDIKSATDPVLRDSKISPYGDPIAAQFEAILNEYKSRTPGFSTDLPARTNYWGEDIVTYEGSWLNAFNMFRSRSAKNQAIDDELIRLRQPLSMPSRSAFGVKLNPKQYHTLMKTLNEIKVPVGDRELNQRQYFNWFIKQPQYLTLPNDELRAEKLKDIKARFVKTARKMLVTPGTKKFDPELFGFVIQAGAQKSMGLPFRP